MEEGSGKSKFKDFFKDKYLWYLFAILLFALVIRLYFFFQTLGQPLWWDEAVNMLQGKHWSIGTPSTGFGSQREIYLPLIYAIFFKFFGFSEVFARIFQLILSTFSVFLVYLVGKEIYDKRIGLLSALLFSVFWPQLFYTYRLNPFIDALPFFLLSIFFFWKGYIKKENKYYIYLSAFIIALGTPLYYNIGFPVAIFFIYLLFTDKFKFLRDKQIWSSLLIAFLVLLPYMLYSYSAYGAPLARLAQATKLGAESTNTPWYSYFQLMPSAMTIPLLLIFSFSLIYLLLNLILGFDLMLKEKDENLNKKLFLLIWLIVPFVLMTKIMVIGVGWVDIIYILPIFPPIFWITSEGIMKLYGFIKKYNREFAIFLVGAILIFSLYSQFKYADNLINYKKDSYLQIKQAGIWLKENSNKDDKIITVSVPQITYYSELASYHPGADEKQFEENLTVIHPKFLMVSIYESHPEWINNWIQKNNLTLQPIQAYFLDKEKTKPALIIYEFKDLK